MEIESGKRCTDSDDLRRLNFHLLQGVGGGTEYAKTDTTEQVISCPISGPLADFLGKLIGVAGFEPATPTSRTWCGPRLDQRLTNDIRELKANIRERSNGVRTRKALKMVGPGVVT